MPSNERRGRGLDYFGIGLNETLTENSMTDPENRDGAGTDPLRIDNARNLGIGLHPMVRCCPT